VLSSVPWRINIPVLDLLRQLWEEGNGFGEIPTMHVRVVATLFLFLLPNPYPA
jgi:DNA-directed RNA polymerase